MTTRSLSNCVISTTNSISRFASCAAWLGTVGLCLFVELFIVMPDARAACLGEMTATITCTTTNTTTTGIGIDTNIDTTVTVDPGVTVSHTAEVIDFSPSGGSATNAVNNDGTITTTVTNAIRGGNGSETVTNSGTGTINGTLLLRNGVDTFNNLSGGLVSGNVILGGGNDQLTNEGTVTGNIDGHNGDDSLTNKGTVFRFEGGSGDDTIINDGSVGQDLWGENGNDIITNTNIITRHLNAGNDDDTVINSGSVGRDLNGDTGNDMITNSGYIGRSLNAGAGTNTIVNTSTGMIFRDILGGVNDDIIDNAGSIGFNLNAGDGTNTVTNSGTVTLDLLGGADVDDITNSGTIMRDLLAGTGDDTISLNTGSSIGGTLDGGSGTDTLRLLGTGTISHSILNIESLDSQGIWVLNVAPDFDDVTISSGTLTLQNALTANTSVAIVAMLEKAAGPGAVIDLSASAANHTVTNAGTMTGDILGGSGDDNLTNAGSLVGTLNAGDGTNMVTNSGSITGSLLGGASDDTISLNTGSSVGGTLDGGSGTDTLRLLGSGVGTRILDHPVSNIEILDLQGDWTLDGNLDFDDVTLSSGTLTLSSGRTLTLQNSLDAPALGTDATVIVESGATLQKAAGSGALIDLSASDETNTVTNDGTLTNSSGPIAITGGSGQEIIANTNMITGDVLGGLGNDQLTNSGSIIGTLNTGDGTNTVMNSGTVTLDLLGGADVDDVTNSGTISGDLSALGGNDTLLNTGTITGSLLAGTGDDTISLNTGSSIGGALDGGSGTDSLTLLGTGTLNSSIANIETLDSQGDWTLNAPAAFVNGATIASGTLALQNTLTANTVIGSGAALMGNGTILGTLTNNGMLSPGNSIGTITIMGNYVQNPGTTLEIEVSPINGLSDQLLISGTAQLGGTLSIIPLGDIPSSNEYTFLTAAGGITGSFDEILQPSAFSFELDFSDPTAVLLKSVSVDFLANALTPNQRATGTYIDRIFSEATPELEANLATLGAIPDTTAYQAALDQLNPEFFDAFTGKTFLENYWFNSALGTRRNQCWRQEPEQAPRLRSCGHRFATWSQLDGSTIGRSGGSQHISYDAEVYNLAMGGFWAPANGRASLQAALGYSHDQLSIIDRGTGSSHRATVGVQGRKYFGAFALAGLVTGGYKWSESDRTITYSTVAQKATASFNSLIASADVRLEYEAFNTQGWYGLTYGGIGTDHMTTFQFSESYAEGLGLNVDGFDATRYGLLAGGSVKRAFPLATGGFVVPEVSLSYMAFLDGVDRTITGRLLGAQELGPTLTATGRGPDERLRLGAWLTTQQSPSLDLSVGFQGSFLDGTQTLGGALQLVYRFN